MEINTKTQDFIRGNILEVPNYEEWMNTHGVASNQEGEYYVWSDKLNDQFEQFKPSMYLEGLPVTNISFTNQGRIDFSYYHHTEDNLYPLGSVFTGVSIEQLEQLAPEQLMQVVNDRIVSSSELVEKDSSNIK